MKTFQSLKNIIKHLKENWSEDMYVRWSRGPKFDKKQKYSLDKVTRRNEPGLSGVNIEKEWLEDPFIFLQRLQEYSFGTRLNDSAVKGWIYKGIELGIDSDGHAAIEIVDTIGSTGKKFLEEIDGRLLDYLSAVYDMGRAKEVMNESHDSIAVMMMSENIKSYEKKVASFGNKFEKYN